MILLINGTSSIGKSSVCAQLQERLASYLLFSTDGFLSMLGAPFTGLHPNNPHALIPNDTCYIELLADGTNEIKVGPRYSQLFGCIADTLALLGNKGFDIIVDAFLLNKEDIAHFKTQLLPHEPYFIYLYANEEMIQQREQLRGDRVVGTALNWLKKFNNQNEHDFQIDTSRLTVEEVCDSIIEVVRTKI